MPESIAVGEAVQSDTGARSYEGCAFGLGNDLRKVQVHVGDKHGLTCPTLPFMVVTLPISNALISNANH